MKIILLVSFFSNLCEAPNAPNFGFWRKILDFRDFGFWGFWILDLGDFGFWILGILDFGDFGSWGFWILGPIQNPKSPNPKSKIQTFLADFGDFGFWILDRYVANLYVAPNFGDFGFWILDLGDFGFRDFGFWILDLGDFGFWGFWILGILDFGFWILDRYVANLYVRPPTPQIWGILDFGDFGDFGFSILGILDFGDFGVWGFWILDCGFWDKFWILHKKKTVHADPGRRIYIDMISYTVFGHSDLTRVVHPKR